MTHTFLPLSNLVEPVDAEKLRHDMFITLRDHRGFLLGWQACDEDDEAFFGRLQGLETREAYLIFRDRLCAHIRIFAGRQKKLALEMRQPGGNSSAQSRHADGARIVSQLIAIRRAGKIWSAARAALRHMEAA